MFSLSLLPARRSRAGFVAAVLLLLGLSSGTTRAAGQPRVAVLDFQGTGNGKDTESLGVGLQSMLTTDLAQVSSISLVERARLRDLQKEAKLSRSALADPATAVKLGKLAGASHLVTGSHTEVNKKMRLDARLIEVASGKVIVASSAEGDLDGFFELEKTLVGKLIEAIGVKMSPKERGAVARIHTTDFEAFRQFSSGVQLFEQEKYEESLTALRAALKKDDDFKLARTTLNTYERLAAELRGRAAELDAADQSTTRVRNQGRQSSERKVFDKLFALVGPSGTKDRFRRAAATYMLACAHLFQVTGATVYGLEDRFATGRTTDALAQRFYPDALTLFPRLPLVVHCLTNIAAPFPRSPEKFDQEFDEIVGRLGVERGEGLKHLRRTREMADHLHLDLRGEANLADKIYELVAKQNPPDDWRLEMLETRAVLHMAVFDFDEAARLQKQAADVTQASERQTSSRAERLRSYAERLEDISLMAATMERMGSKPLLREYALLRMAPTPGGISRRWSFRPKDLAKDMEKGNVLSHLMDFRRMRMDEYVLIGRTPVWLVRGAAATGARTDALSADEVRYHGDTNRPGHTALIFEGVPRGDLKASFEIGFGLPPDFALPYELGPSETLNAAHPNVTFLFGAKCVDCTRTPDPATGGWKFEEQPMEGWGLDIGANEVRLVQVSFSRREGGRKAPSPLALTAKATQAAAVTGNSVPVSIKLQGATVSATIQGKTYSFPVPNDRQPGFCGVLVHGPGFAAIRRIEAGPVAR